MAGSSPVSHRCLSCLCGCRTFSLSVATVRDKWVAPASGISQGDYAPSRQLITPRKRRFLSSGANIQLNKRNVLETEFALSQYDVNTFSSINNEDDIGQAGKILWENIQNWKKDSSVIRWKNTLDVEWLSSTFTPIEQFRTVEFDRDWNVRGQKYFANQYQP